jgi:hypothetical protein
MPVRFLTFLTERTGEARYLEAWQRFRDTYWAAKERQPRGVAYTTNKVMQHLPYAQSHKWGACLEGEAVRIRPLLTTLCPSIEGRISTPFGPLSVKCSREAGKISLETQCEADIEILVELPGTSVPERMSSNENRVFS